MKTYKRRIISGDIIEYEYYKSIKPIGKNYGGRLSKKSRTPEKLKKANQMRAIKNIQRLILCNYTPGEDWWCRFSAPFGTFTTEEDFRREVGNWLRRIKTRLKKDDIKLKYIAFIECGILGKNWHIHIILEDAVRKVAQECWNYKDGMNFTPLYQRGNFEALADYIRKDVKGKKRIMTSRNLQKPEIKVFEAKKRELRKLERGEMIKIPEGYYLLKDDPEYNLNDITGASWYFAFRKLDKVNKRKQTAIA